MSSLLDFFFFCKCVCLETPVLGQQSIDGRLRIPYGHRPRETVHTLPQVGDGEADERADGRYGGHQVFVEQPLQERQGAAVERAVDVDEHDVQPTVHRGGPPGGIPRAGVPHTLGMGADVVQGLGVHGEGHVQRPDVVHHGRVTVGCEQPLGLEATVEEVLREVPPAEPGVQ